jgi:hypothetical protein
MPPPLGPTSFGLCTSGAPINGFTPYVAVLVDETVQVPSEHVRNNEIVLNISFDATSSLKLGNDFIEFKARFSGTAREIVVPISRVIGHLRPRKWPRHVIPCHGLALGRYGGWHGQAAQSACCVHIFN